MSVSFHDARQVAWEIGSEHSRRHEVLPLRAVMGRTLAEPVHALTSVPATDTSAMDGWAVEGEGPWRIDGSVRMGAVPSRALPRGTGRAITTGGAMPLGTTTVLRSERGRAVEDLVVAGDGSSALRAFTDVRRAGEEVLAGDVVAATGTRMTPAVAAAIATSGSDEVWVVRSPRVALVLLGDEVIQEGVPLPGQVRDALGVSVPEVLRGVGMDVTSVTYATDDASAVRRALSQEGVDVVISTGGTGHGHGDHLVPALLRLNAEVLVRGVSMRPGHPTVLAHREDGVPVLGLPGNPFAGLVALIALGLPLLAGLVGSPPPPMLRRVAARPIGGPPSGARLVAVSECAEGIVPVERQGAAMTCGLVHADSIAVIETPWIDEGASARTLSLPWSR